MLLKARVRNKTGFSELIIMLDSGSQTSFITPHALEMVEHTAGRDANIEVHGVGGAKTIARSKKIFCALTPENRLDIPIQCYVLNNFVSPFRSWELSPGDKAFISYNNLVVNHVTGVVSPDVLLGVDFMFSIVRANRSYLL